MIFTPLLLFFLVAKVACAKILRTSGRWIVDAETGDRFKLRCATWAGHLETNIPEGLQHRPVANVARWVADHGFNCVRLTFSTDLALNPNQLVSESFAAATAKVNGATSEQLSTLLNMTRTHNDWLEASTTRGAFERVIAELAAVNVTVVLDNHVSRAGDCCNERDGNGWWSQVPDTGFEMVNSRYFNAYNWTLGLESMASWASSYPNIVGMSLRNELRAVEQQNRDNKPWYTYITEGARAVREVNRNLLIVVGGTEFGTQLGFLWDQQLDRDVFEDKLVYEFHHYTHHALGSTCDTRKEDIGRRVGYLLVQDKPFTGPLFLSSFGWPQNNPVASQSDYARCLAEYMVDNDAEWAYYALQGSYYLRQNVVDDDEPLGLLNHDWSDWRNAEFPQVLGRMFDMTQGP